MDQMLRTTDPTDGTVHLLRFVKEGTQIVLIGRIIEFALRHQLPFGVVDRFIGGTNDVQDNVIIGLVDMMAVTLPIGRAHMDLDVSYPFPVTDLHTCRTIVRTRIAVMRSYGKDLHFPSVGRLLLHSCPQTPFPYVMQYYFWHIGWLCLFVFILKRQFLCF